MTSPADLPPPNPDRGNPVKVRLARVFAVAAGLSLLVASALISLHRGWVPPACAFIVAGLFTVAGFAVLAGKGRQS